ncbi:hypothetical protein EV401DRAFT_1949122 [Pisolithus croceorrhizus]|nr:hypothetical protein EV401DRAFT_1949122 [Pisolithus croceorrhizus]
MQSTCPGLLLQLWMHGNVLIAFGTMRTRRLNVGTSTCPGSGEVPGRLVSIVVVSRITPLSEGELDTDGVILGCVAPVGARSGGTTLSSLGEGGCRQHQNPLKHPGAMNNEKTSKCVVRVRDGSVEKAWSYGVELIDMKALIDKPVKHVVGGA